MKYILLGLFILQFQYSYAQEKTLVKLVSVENGEPIPGATIQVKNLEGPLMSDNNGEFYLPYHDDGQELAIRHVGFETKYHTVKKLDGSFILIKLDPKRN